MCPSGQARAIYAHKTSVQEPGFDRALGSDARLGRALLDVALAAGEAAPELAPQVPRRAEEEQHVDEGERVVDGLDEEAWVRVRLRVRVRVRVSARVSTWASRNEVAAK